MNAFYFGRADHSLFGVYHPPKGRTARDHGIVLCYPLGQEYMRAHRAFRQLANLLSRRGYHVLRFDYYGTGDSMGEGDAVRVGHCLADVGTAIEELKDNANVARVSLIGLRLGATLATLAGAPRADVESIVLWDPVVDGAAYLASLLGGGDPGPEETVGALGFPLAPALRAELADLRLGDLREPSVERLAVLVSAEEEAYRILQQQWRGAGIRFEFECIPSGGNWNEVDNFGSALVPQELIQGIVARFEKESS
jgi:pimeloyl-ACP methyl ester carboxylesterase